MKILLLQLDGKLPNLALMRLAAHHRPKGDSVTLQQCRTVANAERGLWDEWDLIYASLIFERSRPIAARLREVFPAVRLGGTGWDEKANLESLGIGTRQDYSDYPAFRSSIGYTQRGCTFRCSFCKVPVAEGANRPVATVAELWRGEPWPRQLLLLDNDFFNQSAWRDRIAEIRAGGFQVCFSQGINARTLSAEAAAALVSVQYRDDGFRCKRIYTAWDNLKDENTLFRGLDRLCTAGVRPAEIMVYMLIGYDHANKTALPGLTRDDFDRQARLRAFGCLPYPMPFVRTKELVGFQRWVIAYFDVPRAGREAVSWERWERAGYEPRRLLRNESGLF